ncbi:hypothetical protein [Runella salmonicolor]|uniref:SH3 domain-containing protein n=1 Tax=Runella salmonicolor TaxID=2950278 RepID=A0ABT1FGZ5_9BACT|nr:hypothetical protein [Runella salmonicolor]MCP1380996.1 hypothetical protein [Runella salmonicolor]
MEELILLQQLRNEFIGRIQEQWPENFSTLGENYENVASKNAFLLVLQERIESRIASKIGLDAATEYLVSVDFLHRLVYGTTKRLQAKKRDTLAMYLDYVDWEDFVAAQMAKKGAVLVPSIPSSTPPTQTTSYNGSPWQILSAVLVVVMLLGIVWWKMSPKATDFEGASLYIAKREGTSIPSTILLRYELPDQVLDSAFVEVVGNIGMVHRVRLTAQKGYVPATFMSSGIKSAFLEINGKRLQTLSFPVYTEGWGGRIITPARMYPYLKQPMIVRDGALYITSALLSEQSEKQYYETHFSNCRDFGVAGDSSTLEVRVRNHPADGALGCHDIGWVLLDSLGQGYEIHILEKACTAFAQLKINGQNYEPANHFELLSKLGQKVAEWGTLKISLHAHQLQVFYNEKPVLSIPYKGRIDRIKHISCKFMGSGKVDWVRLTNSYTGKVAYFEDFSSKNG